MNAQLTGEIVLYQRGDVPAIDVRLDGDTVWLSLNQIAELLGRDKSTISRHITNVFAEGELDAKTKQLIAVAVAHVTQCPYCIRGHTDGALKAGATEGQIMEAIWVAAEMRAGGAYAHSSLAIDQMAAHQDKTHQA